MSTETKAKKSRAPNWSLKQKEALVDAVSPRYQKLFGAFSNEVTDEAKKRLWMEIAEEVIHTTHVTFTVNSDFLLLGRPIYR